MATTEAYAPIHGYRFQIFFRDRANGRKWEHLAYAVNRRAKQKALNEARWLYGPSYGFKVVPLPKKYWPGITNGI